ncbi:bis(5'-nucleosyl)-tetraphosphatase (symmetrical) [Natronospira proteinivora]|uniref:Bis(5'-nucleosyl)-tetraphosphatase, symmetrical n=1 Tax=Natronospira proteinivora TaxID=1807133 RepID=A0ABT1G7X4_9GAMM|nr:symmetrical bis(5'-nucleosyl)-tetraphosphatase [Natronospira proteinivora]MCP1727395.1 bis(5'-nucleosyl)-tetraphosphatase (symmetrical) [Natronospira proteinivora]
MAIFAIGDIQGCHSDLARLLDRINFDPAEDRVWFAGDIVNRGPASLEALRFVRKLGKQAITVLGNHDMHLLAIAHQDQPNLKSKDTLAEILSAPDAGELLDWLRHRPFLHHDPELGYAMVHAGLPPQWNMQQAEAQARELEQVMQGEHYRDFLAVMYGNEPDYWDPSLSGMDRHRFQINCFTRMRFVDAHGRLDLKTKCAPGEQADGLYPWYAAPGRATADHHILFGHWSTAGQAKGLNYSRYNVYPLDTGCVWGGKLTAFRLDEDGGWASIDCSGQLTPGEA